MKKGLKISVIAILLSGAFYSCDSVSTVDEIQVEQEENVVRKKPGRTTY